MVTERIFDSINHSFALVVFLKFEFGKGFINWVAAVINNPESCVNRSGKTTQCFKLNRGGRQRNLISTFLFILVLEDLRTLIKSGL